MLILIVLGLACVNAAMLLRLWWTGRRRRRALRKRLDTLSPVARPRPHRRHD